MTNKEIIASIIDKLDYIDPETIPNIDLYMDQVTTFMDSNLQNSKRRSQDKILTKTMINNYAKNNLLPPPIKKKYSKDHILMLIFIYYLKNVLSINDIRTLLNPLSEKYFSSNSSTLSLEEIYKNIFQLESEQFNSLVKDVLKKFDRSKEMYADETDKDREFLQTLSFVSMLSFDVYVKKQMIERIIDEMHNDLQKECDPKKKNT